MYHDPDYEYIHKELKKVGVTLKLLWNEYKYSCRTENSIPMGYTKFCEGYGGYTISNRLTNHLEHNPGIVVDLKWSRAFPPKTLYRTVLALLRHKATVEAPD